MSLLAMCVGVYIALMVITDVICDFAFLAADCYFYANKWWSSGNYWLAIPAIILYAAYLVFKALAYFAAIFPFAVIIIVIAGVILRA